MSAFARMGGRSELRGMLPHPAPRLLRPLRAFARSAPALTLLLLAACAADPDGGTEPAEAHGSANAHMNRSGFEELVARFESPERVGWQMPQLVLDALGPLEGRTVMDLGAGTGYFSFRLAEAGARVIAADVDDRFLAYIAARRDSVGLPEDVLSLRKVPYDAPRLEPAELDVFLTVNTYHHIQDRPAYFRKVRHGLDMAGRAVIVDFLPGQTPHGPPAAERVAPAVIVDELRQAGFREILVDSTTLPEQVIVTAFPQPRP
jgi:SAM-dependent methyltransferase